MRDRVWIHAGLLLFLGLFTYPVWHGLAAHTNSKPPALVLPAKAKQCVAPLSYMRSDHMKLLMDWRYQVVRDNSWQYVSYNGTAYEKNLTGTCLNCHNQEKFCQRCHTYVGIRTPYCWSCHIDPALLKRSAQ